MVSTFLTMKAHGDGSNQNNTAIQMYKAMYLQIYKI